MRVGHPPGPPAWAATSARWARGAMSWLAGWGQNHCCGVGAGDHRGLVLQGRDDLGCPGGVASAPVLLEPCVNPCFARSLQLYWGGPGGDGPQRRRRAPGHGPTTASRAGRGLG